jgi:hypothetical protein
VSRDFIPERSMRQQLERAMNTLEFTATRRCDIGAGRFRFSYLDWARRRSTWTSWKRGLSTALAFRSSTSSTMRRNFSGGTTIFFGVRRIDFAEGRLAELRVHRIG